LQITVQYLDYASAGINAQFVAGLDQIGDVAVEAVDHRDPGKSGALRQENLEAVDDARAPCFPSRPHQRGLGTVLPVREVDYLVLGRGLEGDLVPDWRRVDEQGRVPSARRPFAFGRDLPLRKERAQPDGERVRTLRVARRDRDRLRARVAQRRRHGLCSPTRAKHENAGSRRLDEADDGRPVGARPEHAPVPDDERVHRPGACRDVVVLNAGAALRVAGFAESLEEGMATAARAIDDGEAAKTLTRWVEVSNMSNVSG